MPHEFEPWYVKLAREVFAHDPEKPRLWAPLWALINVGSLAAIPGVLELTSIFTDDPFFIAVAFCALGPVCAASLLDGRFRTFAILTLSTWATMFGVLYAWSLTDGWRRDCGLGQSFAIMFTVIGAVAYPMISGAVYAICGAISRAWLSGTRREVELFELVDEFETNGKASTKPVPGEVEKRPPNPPSI